MCKIGYTYEMYPIFSSVSSQLTVHISHITKNICQFTAHSSLVTNHKSQITAHSSQLSVHSSQITDHFGSIEALSKDVFRASLYGSEQEILIDRNGRQIP